MRRGLKRASEGDPEISEICSWISDLNVNEEPHPQVPVREFTDEEEWHLCLLSSLVWMNWMRRKTSPEIRPLVSHSEEWCAKLSVVSAPLWSTIRKEQGIFVLPDIWTTDLQNVACSGCSLRLECEVFRREQDVPAHTHQNSCVRFSTRRILESNSWWCLGNDQNCIWFGRGTR